MANEKILIVEDDRDLSELIMMFLSNEGFDVLNVYDGKEAIEKAKDWQPTLVILDLMLPGTDGISVCRDIRTYSHSPIIIISAKSTDSDKLLSLGMGADDYLTKPFSLPELVARVKSQIRRFTIFTANNSKINGEKRIFGDLVVDVGAFTVTVNGRELPLTVKEFKLIDYFTLNANHVLTKDQIIENVWGFNEFLDDNTIAVHIGRLREKLAKVDVSCIKTIWGVGYKWET